MILKFKVSEQTISALNTKSVPRIGSKDYLVFQFSFSSDWEGLTKIAYLQRDSVSVPIEIKDELVEVPEWFTEQESFNVTLFGTDGTKEVPTNVVAIKLEKSNDLWVKDAPEPTPSWITKLIDLSNHPPIPGSNGFWLLWDTDRDEYTDSQLPLPEATTGGTSDHDKLKNRDAADQHPMSAITGLEQALEGKQAAGNYLTDKDLDTTITMKGKAADAKAVGDALRSLSEEIVTTAASKVSAHNTGTDTHSDIRLLIQGLTDRLNALADSDDTTLDQLSEIVAYIKSNRDLISSITTDKVSVADIVDNLTTNVANKPLSAAQGVALKALIDAITIPGALPNPNALTFTGAVTGSYDGSEPLTVNIPSSEGGSGVSGDLPNWRRIKTLEFSSEIEYITFSEDDNGEAFAVKEIMIVGTFPGLESTGYLYCGIGQGATNALWPTAGKEMRWWLASVDGALKTMLAVSGTAVTGPTDRNTSCPSDLVTICVGASKAFAADGTLYVYGR